MPFCPKCGYEMKADAKFCYRCGEQIAEQRSAQIQAPFQRNQGTAAAAGAPSFQDYLGKLQARLHINAEYSNTLDAYCFRDSQLNAASALSFTKYHYHFFIRYCNGLEPQSAAAFSEACLEDVWASPHHTSLSLNTFAIPVICMDNGNEAVFRSMECVQEKNGVQLQLRLLPRDPYAERRTAALPGAYAALRGRRIPHRQKNDRRHALLPLVSLPSAEKTWGSALRPRHAILFIFPSVHSTTK